MAATSDLKAWSLPAESVLQTLKVDAATGLDSDAIASRRRQWGRNVLVAHEPRTLVSILFEQFKSLVILLLVGAGLLALLFSEVVEAVAIFVVILINTGIGFVTEWRAIRSMEALRRLAKTECVVLRQGHIDRRPAEELVPGDIVVLEAGDRVPADIRLIEVTKFSTDESALTGESLPVAKLTGALAAEELVADRKNMVFGGTVITRGRGRGVVVATGMRTEFGRIVEQVSHAEPQQTPLQKRLNTLGTNLVWLVLAIAVFVAGVGIALGREVFLAIQVAIALSVAAIPEGLPIVATIALARGMWRMARRNALITKLSAVETLGATSAILTDKTGTLTENQMVVTTILLADTKVLTTNAALPGQARFEVASADVPDRYDACLGELLETAVLCNNAVLQKGSSSLVGDPTEIALLAVASGHGLWRDDLVAEWPELREEPFDSQTKLMATVHRRDSATLVCVKGAPEVVLAKSAWVRDSNGVQALSESMRQDWLDRIQTLARQGLRTLAVARKEGANEADGTYSELVLLGVLGLEDPAREGVAEAIRSCRDAGVNVIMVTGDHAATARHIAVTLGIVREEDPERLFVDGREFDSIVTAGREDRLTDVRVFSRLTPEQKLRLIDIYQRRGDIVAMTGDGVNDAPALTKADIGVAMGIRGTAVAREASDMILQDDEFGNIVTAIGQGRIIYENIRKFVVYLLSCNVSEILVVFLATIAGAPLPLLPLQILFLNLVTDVFPALALGIGEGSSSVMRVNPRPASENILMPKHWFSIALHGTTIAATVLAAMAWSMFLLDFDRTQSLTVAFCTLALAQLWHVINMRSAVHEVVRNEITRNPWIWAALLLCLGLVLTAVYLPVLRDVLRLSGPGLSGWLLIGIASVVPVVVFPLVHSAANRLANSGALAMLKH